MRLQNYLNEGFGMNIEVKKVSECSKAELQDFFKLVDLEKQAFTSVATIKSKGSYLAFCHIDGTLAGISSLKKPFRVKDVFTKAGIPEMINKVKYEIGWSVTLPEHRGKRINYLLHKELFEVAEGDVFGTVRDNNTSSLALVKKLGMEQVGEPFEGIGNYNILTFIYRR